VMGGMLSVLVTDYIQFLVMGLGTVVTSVMVLWCVGCADLVGALKDARKGAPADIAFFASDGPVKSVKLKSGIAGYDVNGLGFGGLAFGVDWDADGENDDPLAIHTGGWLAAVQTSPGSIVGDVSVAGADAKGVALKSLKTKGGGFHGDLREPVDQVLQPGQRHDMPGAWAFFFPLTDPTPEGFAAASARIAEEVTE